MDRETARLLITCLGGYIVQQGGDVSICGLSAEDEWIFDVLDLDLERMDLDERIDRLKGGDAALRELLVKSDSWIQATECPTLDIARIIRDEMSVLPGALIVYIGESKDWELWLKVGTEYPVYQSLKRRMAAGGQSPTLPAKRALHAVLVRDEASGYLGWDFATFDGTNWQGWQNGTITGLTRKVMNSIELPDTEGIKWNR